MKAVLLFAITRGVSHNDEGSTGNLRMSLKG